MSWTYFVFEIVFIGSWAAWGLWANARYNRQHEEALRKTRYKFLMSEKPMTREPINDTSAL